MDILHQKQQVHGNFTNSDDSSRLYIAPVGTMFTNNVPNTGLNTIKTNSIFYSK